MDQLEQFGWTNQLRLRWQPLAVPGAVPGRVIADFGTSLKVATPDIITAELSGKLAHYTAPEMMPKVGDWVGVRLSGGGAAVIEQLIPRNNEIARKVAGRQVRKQIMAANVDVAFVLLAMDNDFSPERLSRFLYQLSISRIAPVLVLSKADQTDNVASYKAKLQRFNLPVIASSALDDAGTTEVLSYLRPGRTAILLGSSGVGKSTLTNRLLGREAQATNTVRSSDATGRHTTVHRELFVLPGGGLLIDAPGIRELQLWGTETELAEGFDDIASLMTQCEYTTCQHNGEQGCAIQNALHSGNLDAAHYANYLKMRTELKSLSDKNVVRQRHSNKRSSKSMDRQAQDMERDEW